MNRFYEIGARSAVLSYLLHDDWRDEARRRVAAYDAARPMDNFTYLPAPLLDDYDVWGSGVFVDPHPRSLWELLDSELADNPRAYLVQGVVSTHDTFAEVAQARDGTDTAHHWNAMVLLPDTNIMEEWVRDMGKRFWCATFDLDALFAQFGAPTYIRAHFEGAEGKIFEAYSWTKKPRYIQIVDRFYHLCEDILKAQGYQVVPSLDNAWWISLRCEDV